MLTVRSRPAVETLRAGALEAQFLPEAGLLVTSLTVDGLELLGPLGIPFLHPWANRLDGDRYTAAGRRVVLPADTPRDDHGLPIHGVAPRAWQVLRRSPRVLEAALDFKDPAFPFPHRVEQRAELSPSGLRLETTVRAGATHLPVAFGFHPYLAPPGDRRDWLLSLPDRRRLVADERLVPTGARVPERARLLRLGGRAFDDGYDGLARGASFAVSGDGCRLEVSLERGYGCAQVFAPLDADVVCFEPMTAPANALVSGDGLTVLAPRAVHRAAFVLRVAG